MGIFVTSCATFKCKFDAAKVKLYRSFNAIVSRAGSCASLEEVLQCYHRQSGHFHVSRGSVFIMFQHFYMVSKLVLSTRGRQDRSKCVSTLLYGIEACPVNTRETRSLEYLITFVFFQILKTSTSNLVNDYRFTFGFRQFSDIITDKKNCFNTKYVSSNNIVCKAVSAWTLN